MKNTPYRKQVDQSGVLLNPIKDVYLSQTPNRSYRRKRKQRFFGNGKNTPLTVYPRAKYLRVRQVEFDKEGKKKTIEHYLLR